MTITIKCDTTDDAQKLVKMLRDNYGWTEYDTLGADRVQTTVGVKVREGFCNIPNVIHMIAEACDDLRIGV